MGILSTARVAGLGGANAIKGSVFFPHDGTATTTSGALQVQNENDALHLELVIGLLNFGFMQID